MSTPGARSPTGCTSASCCAREAPERKREEKQRGGEEEAMKDAGEGVGRGAGDARVDDQEHGRMLVRALAAVPARACMQRDMRRRRRRRNMM